MSEPTHLSGPLGVSDEVVTNSFGSKSVIVTGGSRGIGAGIVGRFASSGAKVVFTYFSQPDAAKEVEARTGATAIRLDLGVPSDVDELFDTVRQLNGGVDIVVNNAAVLNPSTVVSEITDDDFAFVMDGNLRGSFHILRRAARDLRHDGRIINISTLDTTHASAGNALYAASKAAVEQLVAGIAQEVGSRGITANTVSPGATDTSRLRSRRSDEVLASAALATPLGRLGSPDDIAAVVAFLASEQARWITGANIRATGGLG